MSLDAKTVHKIAHLAKLKVPESQIDALAKELSNILELVETMNEVDTSQVAPLMHPGETALRFRDDDADPENRREALQALAPDAERGLYRVPKVID